MQEVKTETEISEGNRIIAEFDGKAPEIEYCVGNEKKGTICFSPKNVGSYFSYPESQKTECERWLKEQRERYPEGWVTKEGYTTRKFLWYPRYNQDWNLLIPVWVKYRNLEVREEIKPLHLNYVARLSQELSYADTPADFFPHLLIAIKWYNSNNHTS